MPTGQRTLRVDVRWDRLWLTAFALAVLACTFVIVGFRPLMTNDGPVHLSFGNFLTLDPATHPNQFAHYTSNPAWIPNMGAEVVLSWLLTTLEPAWAESLVQWLCTVGVVLAAVFAFRQIRPESWWIGILVLPLTLNRFLFLGMYSFGLSLLGFFLSIAAFVATRRTQKWSLALLTIVLLHLTLASQASGFVAAIVVVLGMILSDAADTLRRGTVRQTTLSGIQQVAVVAALVPAALLSATTTSGTATAFGPNLWSRLWGLQNLSAIWSYSDRLGLLVRLVGPILLIATVLTITRRAQAGDTDVGPSIHPLGIFAGTLTLALVFPDQMGGGWMHADRMSLFVFLGAALSLACVTVPPATRAILSTLSVVATVGLLYLTAKAQLEIQGQAQPFDAVQRIVGEHCSVLPVVIEPRPTDANGREIEIRYLPYLQLATRLELAGDRVALYNYQARTGMFPVRVQPGTDPQALIFHWTPTERRSGINVVDVVGYERATGRAVDYILQWGPMTAARPSLRRSLANAVQGATLVYQSPRADVALFRRHGLARSLCE